MGESYRATDATGIEIHLKQPAERIICLTATGIDVLAELGLDPVGYLSQGIADRPEFYGEHAQQFTSVGSWMLPNPKAIRNLQPDLILGWEFPHRFYQRWLRQIAPTYLMSGSGYNAALARLRDVAQLTGRTTEAEAAIQQLETQLETYRATISTHQKKTVLMMGGSTLNFLSRRFIVETNVGTAGSLLQELTHYPWIEPAGQRMEPGLMTVPLDRILQVNPDVIFVQTYPPSVAPLPQQLANQSIWKRLKAVQTGQVHEVEQFWHSGNGTRIMQVILNQLMPIIYPEQVSQIQNS
ncbi:ABC transporter substrate-binding protein [Egbenema bharatensis]|uniref:ABC transporter substrate-binding protein n=1 Tax=Egbenema bharatensis TaxID=3463334 RepID=UPI003A846007